MSKIHDWIDEQTAERKPAVLMVYEGDDDSGHVYLCNGPAFGMAAIVVLDVPLEISREVGDHLDFLWREHLAGKWVTADQTTAQKIKHGYRRYWLDQPDAETCESLLQNEMAQTGYRWPDADVLLLVPIKRWQRTTPRRSSHLH